ncbi:hypothetical protein WJX82_003243 [Trebouxia sp. C0006]
MSTDAATEVILRFNFMGGRESKGALLCVALSIVVGAGVLIAEFVHKMQLGSSPTILRHKTTPVWNVAIGSTCLLLVTLSLGSLLWRVLAAVRLHKHWKHRQRRNVTLIVLEAILQWLNLVFYVVPNALNVATVCYFLADDWFYFGFARWTCWNTIFMLFLMHAYSTRIWKRSVADDSTTPSAAANEHGFQSPEGHSKLIMDGPWRLLWPCLLLWPCFEGIVGYGFIYNGIDAAETVQLGVAQDGVVAQTLSGTNYGFCREFPEYIDLIYCGVGHPTSVIVDCIVACALLYFAITYVLLLSKLRGYRKQPYTFVQVGLVYNTLQLWLRMAVMSFFTLCLVLLWLVGPGWCTSEEYSWLGLMPMQIVMTANTVVLCYVASPRTPQERAAASTVWLQEFAWTEADKPVKLEARATMVPDNPKLAKQPIFCFQTMMNLLYWSCYVYDHSKEPAAGNPNFDASRPSAEQKDKQATQEKLGGTSFTASTTLNVDTALSLYKLTRSQSFWETKQDTRCLVGWGNSTVVVAFRGTASMKNALADLQAWRIAHPPMRGTKWLGTRPLVHVGFLKSWLAGGLKYKVVSHILEAVRQCKQESGSDQPVKIFVTGHSLGGALATLAAFDIRRHLLDNMQSDAEVVCYTFAAPRTGNHAFAREYNAMVPDSWSVINDQDVVTREGKMLFLYKRPGQRVILNAAGHMMVRPTHMEVSVQKSVGGQSVRHHMLTNYMHAILSVVLAQFTGLGFLDGMEGVIKLAEASPYMQELLETQMGMDLPNMRAFCQTDASSRISTSSMLGLNIVVFCQWQFRGRSPSVLMLVINQLGRIL